jgi:hypothetical protein
VAVNIKRRIKEDLIDWLEDHGLSVRLRLLRHRKVRERNCLDKKNREEENRKKLRAKN